jgi:hypothetical protein
MYFECDAMNCREVLEGHPTMPHCERLDWEHAFSIVNNLFFKPNKTGILSPSHRLYRATDRERYGDYKLTKAAATYRDLIERYSQRELTFDRDILGAFAGICAMMARSPYRLSNLWGLPLATNELSLHSTRAADESDRLILLDSLCWHHHFRNPLLQRPKGFPSWSWAAWQGGPRMASLDTDGWLGPTYCTLQASSWLGILCTLDQAGGVDKSTR